MVSERFPLAFRGLRRQNSRLFFAPNCFFVENGFVANIKSAEKRAKQAVVRRAHNMAARSRLRTAIKTVDAAVKTGNKEDASAKLKLAMPVIDSMVNKGIIHRNAAARYKSGLNARVKTLVVG